MSIDDRNPNGDAGAQPELLRGFGGETVADRFAHRTNRLPDPGKVFSGEIAEPDLLKIDFIPAFARGPFVSEVSPFADGCAERSRVVSRGAVG